MTAMLRVPGRTDGAVAGATALAALGAAFVVAWKPASGLFLGLAALGTGLVLRRPVAAAVIAAPGLWAAQRAGPTGLSDLLLFVAALLALPALAGSPALRSLRPLNRAFALYLFLLLPSLAINQTLAADFEWAHRLLLVLGAALVGAWLVVERQIMLALRLFLLVSAFFAVAAMITAVQAGFEPAYPFGFHKNYAGSLLSLAFLVTLTAPHTAKLKPLARGAILLLMVGGTVATQSRGAMLGAALGALLWFLAPGGERLVSGRTRVAGAAVAVLFAGYAGFSVNQQLDSANSDTNSVGVRRDVENATQDLWRSSPLVGVGIRYFKTEDFGRFATASNNAVNSELAESGVLGATGFVLFHGTAIVVLFRRRHNELGLAALATVSCQLLHGMVDIYWSAGVSPLPWMLSGMALAAGGREPA